MRDLQVSLSDGRELAYTDIGEPGWPCVLFFHGAPMSRLYLAYLEEQFLANEVRVVSPDRPGYGRSSPQPGRSMADWPADVAALADALAIDRLLVAVHSAGGPYAIACAALLPERVSAGVVFAGVTDMAWSGATEGYFDLEVQLMGMTEEEAIAFCVEQFGADGSGFLAALSDFELSEPDSALFVDEEAGPALTAAMAEAFRQGVGG